MHSTNRETSNLFVLLIAWKPDFLFLKIKSIFYLYVFQFSIGKKNLAKVTEQLSEDNIAYRRTHNRQLGDNDKTRKEEASNFHLVIQGDSTSYLRLID